MKYTCINTFRRGLLGKRYKQGEQIDWKEYVSLAPHHKLNFRMEPSTPISRSSSNFSGTRDESNTIEWDFTPWNNSSMNDSSTTHAPSHESDSFNGFDGGHFGGGGSSSSWDDSSSSSSSDSDSSSYDSGSDSSSND